MWVACPLLQTILVSSSESMGDAITGSYRDPFWGQVYVYMCVNVFLLFIQERSVKVGSPLIRLF